MSVYTTYYSETELREALSDVEGLLEDFRATQETLDEQRAVLGEQVQGALAEYEQRVGDYEARRDCLDQRQAELREQRLPFEQARDRLQQQLDAKRAATLGPGAAGGGTGSPPNGGDGEERALGAERQQERGGPAPPDGPVGITSMADLEKLKSQLARPKATLELKPPGAGGFNPGRLDEDLKRMADIRKKQGRLTDASINMRSEWNRSGGPKP